MSPPLTDHTHDPAARSWVPGADTHADFPVQNLPLGVFSPAGGAPRIGTAIGDYVLDVAGWAASGALPAALADAVLAGGALAGGALAQPTLNALFRLGGGARRALRHALFAALTTPDMRPALTPLLHRAADCTLHLPFAIGDYSDFYVGIHHATAIGRLLRPDNPLLPNYKYVPIGYHGRASSVRVSGTPVVRPWGQLAQPDGPPCHAPSRRLDYEVELGLWLAGDNALGETVPMAQAWERIGGLCLVNDWSARDMQAWEYQPLGPFLAKSFCTSVSPWVITAEALAPFRIARPPRPAGDPAPLAYLDDAADAAHGALALTLGAAISTPAMRAAGLPPHPLSQAEASAAMYWTAAQILTHHASNGCDLHAGDLIASGTLSGPAASGAGSLMELSQAGRAALALPGGEERCFLEDGDEIILSARASGGPWRAIGFGACTGRVMPARRG